MADETATLTSESAAPPPETAPPPSTPTDWRQSLPEELRGDKSLEPFKDVGALAKGYVSLQPLLGAKIPEGLTAQQVTEYLGKKQQVPTAPEKYTVKPPEFPEGIDITWDAGLQSQFLARAHKAGMTNTEAQDWINWWGQAQLAAHDSALVQSAEAEQRAAHTMRQEWGSAYERNLGLARATAAQVFGNSPTVLAAFEARGDDPDVLKGLQMIGEILFERGEIRGDAIGGGQSVEEIETELNRIRDDPKNAGNLNVVDRILALTTTLDRLKERQGRR